MKLVIRSGAGYIGIHTCVELLNQAHQVFIIDHLINSKPIALERLAEISNKKLIFDLSIEDAND